MSQNRELVATLLRIQKDSDLVLKLLADQNVNESNYKQVAFNTDTISGELIEQLFQLQYTLQESIEQYDF